MNHRLDNRIVDIPLGSLGKETRPREEAGVVRPELRPPGSQPAGLSPDAMPLPAPAQPAAVHRAVLCAGRLHVKAALGEIVCW